MYILYYKKKGYSAYSTYCFTTFLFFSPLNTYSGYHLTSAYTHLPHFCLTACMVFHSGSVPRLFPHFDEHFALIRNQIFVCICGISKKKTPRSEISGSKDKGAYSFFMYFQILIYTRSTFCILASTIWKHLFPRAWPTAYILKFMYFCESNERKVISQCNFKVKFSYFEWYWTTTISCLQGAFTLLFMFTVYSLTLPIFPWDCCFSVLN